MTNRRIQWLLMGILVLGFVLRLIGLEIQSLWRDEVDAILFATRPFAELLDTFSQPGQNGPLYFLVLRPWLAVAGRSEFALRFFSLIFGLLCVPLSYQVGRKLFPRLPLVGLLGALLAATSPYLVWYSQEGKMYALVTCLVLLAMDRYLEALSRGGWGRWLAAIVATSAAFYVHFIAALMVPVQALVFFLSGRETMRRRWKPWLGSMAALTLPYLPLIAWQLPMLLQPAETGYDFVSLDKLVSSLLSSYSLGVIQAPTLWSMAPYMGLLLAGAGLGLAAKKQRFATGTLIAWLLVPILGLFLVTLVRPMYTARYLIFILPAGLLLIAFGLVAVSQRSRLVGGLLLVALLALNGWGLWLQYTTPLKADFRGATAYVSQSMAPNDLVLFQIPHGRYSFDYYFDGLTPPDGPEPGWGDHTVLLPWVAGGGGEPYRSADGPYTNHGMPEEDLARRMTRLTEGSGAVWLVATEVPLWDERRLTEAWLAENGQETDRAEFTRVVVVRYTLAP